MKKISIGQVTSSGVVRYRKGDGTPFGRPSTFFDITVEFKYSHPSRMSSFVSQTILSYKTYTITQIYPCKNERSISIFASQQNLNIRITVNAHSLSCVCRYFQVDIEENSINLDDPSEFLNISFSLGEHFLVNFI